MAGQAPLVSSNFSDWQKIWLEGAKWQNGAGSVKLVDDVLNIQADQTDAADGSATTGGATPKITIAASGYTGAAITHFYELPIPDYVLDRQPGGFRHWAGTLGTAYEDPTIAGPLSGGRRVSLQIEYVLNARTSSTIGANLLSCRLAAKFRGYGARTLAATNNAAAGLDLQDTPVADSTFQAGASTDFNDMAFPSVGTSTKNTAVTFGANGVARLQWVIEIPDTIGVGDWIEITQRLQQASAPVTPMQYQYARYRWLRPPFPFVPNRGLQCSGQTATTAGADGQAQLTEQSRIDLVSGLASSPTRP